MQLINRGPGLRKLAVAAPQESQLHHLGTDFLAVLEILSNPQCLHASITLFCLLAVERAWIHFGLLKNNAKAWRPPKGLASSTALSLPKATYWTSCWTEKTVWVKTSENWPRIRLSWYFLISQMEAEDCRMTKRSYPIFNTQDTPSNCYAYLDRNGRKPQGSPKLKGRLFSQML